MSAVPILLYHSVADGVSPRFRPWAVPPALFRDHMRLIADEEYTPITVGELTRSLRGCGTPLPPRPVVLTFDDGFADFHTDALPVMADLGQVSTLYVTTAYLGRRAQWLEPDGEGDRPMLGWGQLREIAAAGVEIGAHSHTHPKLDEIGKARATVEITTSKHILEDGLQQETGSFAYPHGYHGPTVRRLVVEGGFTSAAAVRHAMSSTTDDLFALSRIVVTGGTGVAHLQRLLRGDGLRQAPCRTQMRTHCWRLARQARSAARSAVRNATEHRR